MFGFAWLASYVYALWAFAMAKGRSGAWVMLGLVMPLIGLIVILLLKDHRKEGVPSAPASAPET